ncbi:ABC transporter permease [Paucisalibacillus sp. EB02]|uniref:ABC transporter permease n=1 Tax=Paucisalibacillus sp. EB02 TaxID=1347087 RepID=UPI0005AAF924|nr:ABC transporter permease [Paucisalibacillus sp. EB02]
MNKFIIIMTHTYLSKLKTKVFYISTFLILAFLMIMVNFESIISVFTGDEEQKVAVMEESGELLEYLTEQPNNEVLMEAFTGTVEEGKSLVVEEEYEALVIIELDDKGLPEATFFAENITNSDLQTDILQQLQQLKVTLATDQLGIDQTAITEIFAPVTLHKVALDEDVKTEEEMNQARGIVYVMLILLYTFVIMYGSLIATDVATEKSSRVMEIIVSSVSPITHMFAKILGIAMLGLTQIAIFLLVGIIMLQSKTEQIGGLIESFGLHNASISIILYAVLFFLLGFFLYATLAAMLGSLVSRVEEANQIVTPIVLLIIIGFFIAIFGMNAPDSQIVTITSYIPFFAPLIMFLRVGLMEVPLWEILLSVGILVGTIILLAIIGAKVYKGGVLLYGRSSSFKDIKKAIQLTKKE